MPINPVPVEDRDEMKRGERAKREISYVITEPRYSFEDIILPEDILKEIENLIALDRYKSLIFETWGLADVIKRQKNITANFYGKSGTGKTMTAHAIAGKLDKKLLMVNYAEIESKYVGETSKNLVNLFESAKKQDAIILFDEADALLSKRVTTMQSAADVSVNQTRNVLLKLLDEYDGMILFTTNFISNFDSAFFRRIMSHIKFELPNERMRQQLWFHYLVDRLPIEREKTEIVRELSKVENVSGSDISNAVLRAAILAAQEGSEYIKTDNLKSIINKILEAKSEIENGNFEVSTRKVSAEYVKEKLGKEAVNNGINSVN